MSSWYDLHEIPALFNCGRDVSSCLMVGARGVVVYDAEVRARLEPHVVRHARMKTWRIVVLPGVRRRREQRVHDVRSRPALLEIRPIRVLHHDHEHRADGRSVTGGDDELGALGRVRRCRPVVIAIRAGSAGTDVDESHACVPGAVFVVDGILHHRREIPRDRRTIDGAHVCRGVQRTKVTARRGPWESRAVRIPRGLRADERFVHPVRPNPLERRRIVRVQRQAQGRQRDARAGWQAAGRVELEERPPLQAGRGRCFRYQHRSRVVGIGICASTDRHGIRQRCQQC